MYFRYKLKRIIWYSYFLFRNLFFDNMDGDVISSNRYYFYSFFG